MDIEDRLDILADAAKYDVSCSSSGPIGQAAWGMPITAASVTAGRRTGAAFHC